MRKQFSIFLLTIVVALFYHFAATAALGQSTIFGPKTYVRNAGPPQTTTDTFSVESLTGPFFFSVSTNLKNGENDDDGRRIRNRRDDKDNGQRGSNEGDNEDNGGNIIVKLNGLKIFTAGDDGHDNGQNAVVKKSVSLQLQNTISVELRGKPGSSVTVTIGKGSAPPTSTEFTVYTNPADPLWLREETPQGDIIDFYGERDSEGLPTVLYGANVTRANGDEITYYLDEQGRPVLMGMPNGVTFSIEWQTETLIKLTAVFGYGDSQITVPIDLTAQSTRLPSSQFTTGLLAPASFRLSSLVLSDSTSGRARAQNVPPGATTVKVTRCGVPINSAFVRIPIEGRPGPPILAKPIGGGVYIAALPTPPPNFARPINRLCTRIQQRISQVCDKILALRLGGVQTGMICNAIFEAAQGEPHIEELGIACKIGFGALSLLCSVAKPCAAASGFIDRAISAPITFRPIATLYGITSCGNPVTAPPNGPFPTALPIDFPCACQSGFGARLFSTGRNIQITVLPPRADFTSEIRLSSPVFRDIASSRYTGPPINISSYRVGAELIFSIYVSETGQTFYTGPGSRNPDGLVHAKIDCLSSGRVRVSFEDFLGGGDNDFDDAVFEIISGGFEGPICR